MKRKFKIGDKVRVSNGRYIFEGCTGEVSQYYVSCYQNPIYYRIKLDKKIILSGGGTFAIISVAEDQLEPIRRKKAMVYKCKIN